MDYIKYQEVILARKKIYYQKNRKKILAQRKQSRLANPEKHKQYRRQLYIKNRDRMLATNKKWAKENKETIRINRRKLYQENPNRQKEANRRWYLKNKDRFLVSKHNRRTRINKNGGKFTRQEWRQLKEKYKGRCLCCGIKKPLSVDHIIPIFLGGSNSIENIQPLCRSCNIKKGLKIIDYR